jgi:hypothetical protein
MEQLAPFLKQLRPLIREAFGDALTAQFGSGELAQGYGSTSLFTSQHVGMNYLNAMQRGAADASMHAAATETAEARRQFQADTINTYGHLGYDEKGARIPLGEEEVQRLINSPMSLQAAGSGHLYDMIMSPELFHQGLREGNQYMGVAATGANQSAIREEASLISGALAKSWNKGTGDLFATNGQDSGRLFAELSRTGAFNAARQRYRSDKAALGEDASEEDLLEVTTRMTEETSRLVHQASQSVSTFRQFFTGSVTQIFDKINGLMGTDVIATFKGAENNMMNNMLATGMATGLGTGSMLGFAGKAHNYLTAAGHDPLGSVTAGTIAGGLLGQGVDKSGSAFINRDRLEDTFVLTAAQAVQSRIARAASGAASLITDPQQSDAFHKELASGNLKTGFQIAEFTSNLLGLTETLSPFDLQNLGNSNDATLLRTGNSVYGNLYLNERADKIKSSRLSILGTLLQGTNLSEADRIKALADVRGGDLTSTSMIGSLGEYFNQSDNDERADFRLLEGKLSRALNTSHPSNGGNMHEVDRLLSSIGAGPPDVGSMTNVLTALAGTGGIGVRTLKAFMAGDPKEKGWEHLLGAVMGDNDIDNDKLASFIGVSEELVKSLGDDGTAVARDGLTVSLQALQNNTYRNKNLTQVQQEKFRAPFAEGLTAEARLKLLTTLGEEAANYDASLPLANGGMADLTLVIGNLLKWLQDGPLGFLGSAGSPPQEL